MQSSGEWGGAIDAGNGTMETRLEEKLQPNGKAIAESGEMLMQYQVLVQSHSDTKFVASVIGIPNAIAEGQTREEAIIKAKHALQQQLEAGELVTIQLDAPLNGQETDPWIKHMGIFADDSTFDDFLAEVAAYRQQVDAQVGEE